MRVELTYYDDAALRARLEQLVEGSPEKAWMLEVFSVLSSNMTAFPPQAEDEQRFVTDFFYPH